jgi:protease IV
MAFLGRLFRGLWRVLDGLRKVLHLGWLLLITLAVVIATRQPLPFVPARAALVLHPEGRLVEQLTGSAFDRSIGALTADHEPETLVRDLTEAIRAAAHDSRIKLMVLDLEDMGGAGLTKLETVASAIRDFRASGKKVLAHARYATQEQYYLMAQADEVYLEPGGEVAVIGYGAYRLYFHDALERLGVDINVFKVGTHKSFTEPYTRNDMSPEDREQTLGILTPLWDAYQQGVERGRKLPAGSVEGYLTELVPLMRAAGGDAALVAEQKKLITGRKSELEFEQQVTALVGSDDSLHSFNGIGQADYLAALHAEKALARHADEVAVLVASGEIVDGERPPGEIGGDSFAALVRKARFDDSVKAVVLRIDSGGGSMVASEVIRQEVAALKAAGKPVVASFASVAASGGYYIAMDADEIWAEPTTITGSIGVFGIVPTFARTLGKLGVSSDGVATSPLAGAMNLERSMAPEAREVLQLGVEHAYHEFVAHVAGARHHTPEEIEAIAEGRVWVGSTAQKLGLIDQLGTVEQAVAAAALRAHLAPGHYRTSYREKDLTWRELFVRQLHSSSEALARSLGFAPATPTALGRVLSAAEHQLRELEAFNDPRRIYYYCGCDLR